MKLHYLSEGIHMIGGWKGDSQHFLTKALLYLIAPTTVLAFTLVDTLDSDIAYQLLLEGIVVDIMHRVSCLKFIINNL
jgi:hypothetical protein